MTVGDRIRYYRTEQHVSLKDLAGKVGVATQTIFKYEHGIVDENGISLSMIARIGRALDVDPAILCGWPREGIPSGLDKTLARLNDAGKERVAEYAEDLVASGRYSKSAGAAIADRA